MKYLSQFLRFLAELACSTIEDDCPRCDGTGTLPPSIIVDGVPAGTECPRCEGRGMI